MKKDSDKLKGDRFKAEEELRKQVEILTEENKKLLAHNSDLLGEKTHALMNFNSNLNVKICSNNSLLILFISQKQEKSIKILI